ncbi:MAG: CvpA family protein [Planctomycetaceae bacterium]|nr:CvpA family protein [Planctomycetaceae bacterium]
MSSILTLLMLVIVFACVAMLYTEGMWSNAISLINVVTAALLATNFFEPLARWLDSSSPSLTYAWDFLALWGLFAVFMALLRAATDQLSKVKVRFLTVADRIGSVFFAMWIGWVLVCFTMMTLHTAPLSRNFLFGGFTPEQSMVLGLAPDRQWLGFVQKESMGVYARSATPEQWQQEKFIFDPKADFMPNYTARRVQVEQNVARNDSICPK